MTKTKKKAGSVTLPRPMVQLVNSANLEVLRDAYQKPLNAKRVAQIVADFDERIANEPKVSYRDGHYYVFDGQHTVAARILKKGGHLPIYCKVYTSLTKEQEALLFAEQTGHAAMPTPANRLRARLYAGDKESVAFKDATESAGFVLDLDGSRSNYHIHCINSALRMYRMAGREKYKEALELMALAWKGSKDSLLNEVLIAVAEFVRVYSGKYNAGILVEALKKHKPRVIAQNIKSDFEHPGFKKHIYQIYKIYNDSCGDVKLPRCF